MEENAERQHVSTWFREAWGQALAAASSAEKEAQELLHKAGGMVGWSPDEAWKQAREFGERLGRQRKEIEKSVEDRVRKAVGKLRVPRREDVDAMRARIDRVAERIEAIWDRR